MENSTKALIIAGAILITITLISLGLVVINKTRGTQNVVGDNSESMAVQTFNSQFTSYVGDNIKAIKVKDLISLVKSSNIYYGFDDSTAVGTNKFIKIEKKGFSTISASKTYKVQATYSQGYVSVITIEEN